MKTRKILAVILSVAMLLSLLTQAVWADNEQSEPQETQGFSDPLQGDSEGNPNSGISPMSLLPLEYYYENVTIDRTEKMPYELVSQPEGTVYVYEVLKDALIKHGLMTEEDEKYSGTIVYSLGDELDYAPIEWDGMICFGTSYYRSVYFILGDGDQLNPKNIKICAYVNLIQYIEDEVTIDRTENFPEELIDQPEGTVYISELLNNVLLEKGLITEENPKYNGTIKIEEYGYNSETGLYSYNWKEVTQEDSIVAYASDYSTTANFILDDGLETDTSFKKVRIRYKYIDTGKDLLSETTAKVFNDADEEITVSQKSVSTSYIYDENWNYVRIYSLSNVVSGTELKKDTAPKINLTLSEKYAANTVIYLGHFKDESGMDESQNITDQIIGTEPYQFTESTIITDSTSSSSTMWYLDVTLAVTIDEKDVFIPTRLAVNVSDNYVTVRNNANYYTTPSYVAYASATPSEENYIGYCDVVSAPDFDHVRMALEGVYYNYIGSYSTDYYGEKVTAAYLGEYGSEEEAIAAGAENIKEKLFSNYGYYADFTQGEAKTAYAAYNRYYSGTQPELIEIQLKSFVFTVFDEYGLVHHPIYYIGIDTREVPKALSDDTYFRIEGADIRTDPADEESSHSLSGHVMVRADDSYSVNGYQTVFIMDGEEPIPEGATIYPTFDTDPAIKIFNGLDASEETGTNHQQISGKSPVVFSNAKPIQYSAASESGTHLKNYWVTYITPTQGGAKLFVNATNNPAHYDKELGIPVREIFFNSSYGYSHDIMFANIGDQNLTGIKVSLENANGIELDPYWTVLESGVKKLAPYTSVYAPSSVRDDDGNYIRYNGELSNIAKIRLNPTDENFGVISGTLRISADNQEEVVIKLTGIAGTPRIVTDKIYDGVKYVPYSSVIMTNSMYETDAMKFSIVGGALPNGIELLPNGELYGIPTEVGEFTFTVQAKYTGTIAQNSGDDYTDSRTYTMTVKDNSDENVDAVNVDEQGYELTDRISKYVTVYYNGVDANNMPIIDRVEIDSNLFHSEGSYTDEFKAFYIDSIKLTEGVDYIAEEGSTKITVLGETFGHIGLSDGNVPHTLAAEFRNDASELKRSAQNVYLEYINKSSGNPSNPGTWWPSNPPYYPTVTPSFNAVNIIMIINDASGNAVPNLSLELHSAVQYATCNSDGIVSFSNVEFGRHTLYITDPNTNVKTAKTFTLVSGFDTEITDDIIVAEVGQTIALTITFDGGKISFVSAKTDVDIPEAGTTNEEDSEDIDATVNVGQASEGNAGENDNIQPTEESNPKTGIVSCVFLKLLVVIGAISLKKRR